MLSSNQQGSIIQSFLLESGSGQNATFILMRMSTGKTHSYLSTNEVPMGYSRFFASIGISVRSKGDTMQDHVVD